jgi:hypothetical protein
MPKGTVEQLAHRRDFDKHPDRGLTGEELLQLARGRLGSEPAVTGLLLLRQVLNWHAKDRMTR